MIYDARTQFASATSIGTPNNQTVNVGDVIDTATLSDLGQGQRLYLVVLVTTTFTSGGATAISLLLSSDSTSTLSTDDTQTTHWESDSVDEAQYAAGKRFIVPVPSEAVPTQVGSSPYERFLGVQVRNRSAVAITGGAISAFLTADPTKWVALADAAN